MGAVGEAFVETHEELATLLQSRSTAPADVDMGSVDRKVKDIHGFFNDDPEAPDEPEYPLSLDKAIRHLTKVRKWLDARLSSTAAECASELPGRPHSADGEIMDPAQHDEPDWPLVRDYTPDQIHQLCNQWVDEWMELWHCPLPDKLSSLADKLSSPQNRWAWLPRATESSRPP